MKVVLNLAKKEQKALFVIFGGTGDLAQRHNLGLTYRPKHVKSHSDQHH